MSDFRDRAACRDVDPEFFPIGNAGPAQRQIAAAKVVCLRCPVIDCLAWLWTRATPKAYGEART